MLNILYHHRTQGIGAEGVHIREIIKSWLETGHCVDVLSPPGVDPFKDDQSQNLSTPKSNKVSFRNRLVWALPQFLFEILELGYNFWAYPKIKKALKFKKYDFVYERYSFFSNAAAKACRKFNVPLILEVNEICGIKRQRKQTFVQLCEKNERKVFQQASLIIVVSDFLKQQIIEKGIDEAKIVVIPNGVNANHFDLDVQVTDLQEKYHLKNRLVIEFVGMFSVWDSLSDLLQCFAKIHKKYPQVYLILVGDGLERPRLESLTKELKIQDDVLFAGKVSRRDIPKWIKLADICTLSDSNPFGSPIAMFECMVMEKVVVVPDYSPITRVVTHGEDSLVFEPKNWDQYVDCLCELIADQEKRKRLSLNARKKILAEFLWANNAAKVIELFEERLK